MVDKKYNSLNRFPSVTDAGKVDPSEWVWHWCRFVNLVFPANYKAVYSSMGG